MNHSLRVFMYEEDLCTFIITRMMSSVSKQLFLVDENHYLQWAFRISGCYQFWESNEKLWFDIIAFYYWLISRAEVYLEPSRTYTMGLT